MHYFLFKSFFSTHTGFGLNPELVNYLAHRIPLKVERRLNIFPDLPYKKHVVVVVLLVVVVEVVVAVEVIVMVEVLMC